MIRRYGSYREFRPRQGQYHRRQFLLSVIRPRGCLSGVGIVKRTDFLHPILAAEFYDHPERELTLVGITGTKGKTTTAYFTQAILNAYSGGRCALFSSVDNCLDGHTYAESDLTTPESFDALRMMREAVDNGMTYLVMEVSSQAYKVQRVYGFTFDVGAFLNITPDHISPIEHPTLEDYEASNEESRRLAEEYLCRCK